jgi:hypothetical protein
MHRGQQHHLGHLVGAGDDETVVGWSTSRKHNFRLSHHIGLVDIQASALAAFSWWTEFRVQ